jgi:hypothetical protein
MNTRIPRAGELDMMRAKDGELRDLSPGAFRFLAVLIVAAAVLLLSAFALTGI